MKVACLIFWAVTVCAQETIHFASVSGRVTDPSGAVVEGAQVNARQTDTNLTSATKTDREGRFRVNDVFCFDTAWRSTVESLMDMSDAILLDLRGFQAKRAGTAYEITRLAAHGRLRRVVAIGDKLTDWAHVDTLLDAAGRRDGPRETRLHADVADLARLCIASLCAVASQSEPAPSGLR